MVSYGQFFYSSLRVQEVAKKGIPEKEVLFGTWGRLLTQRHLPTTLQKVDDTFCAAKVQNILLCEIFFLQGKIFLLLLHR